MHMISIDEIDGGPLDSSQGIFSVMLVLLLILTRSLYEVFEVFKMKDVTYTDRIHLDRM